MFDADKLKEQIEKIRARRASKGRKVISEKRLKRRAKAILFLKKIPKVAKIVSVFVPGASVATEIVDDVAEKVTEKFEYKKKPKKD